MAEIQRTFLAGRMNKDLDERLLPDGEYRDAVNITIDTSEGSNIGAIQNAYGNSLIGNIASILNKYQVSAPINPITIGSIAYDALNVLYWFVKADNFEGIFEYNQITNNTLLVLGSTTNQLNFNKNYLITGVNYVTDGNGSGLLIWNDNLNPPRKINISRCKTYSVNDPRINDDINLIVAPPLNSPFVLLSTLPSTNLDPNNIEDKFVYFSYRYEYSDNEFSAMSPLSAVAFNPKNLNIDPQTGENKGMLNKYNQASITLQTGNQFVKSIQLLVWESRTLNVKIVETLDKEELNIPDNSEYTFVFMNNKTYAALPSDQVTRLFDNVPLKALAQEIIGSRLIMGNYTQFRDLVGYHSNDFIDVNYNVEYINEPVTTGVPKQTWRSDRDYEVGIAYLDNYGRMTTVLTTSSDNTGNNSSNSVYISPSNSSTANSLVVRIKNEVPAWATGYRLFIKQSKTEYYNLFPVTYLVSGSYRYFLINEADRDKIKVNGYIIFKSSGSGPTNSNKKFKVLELEQKAGNFIPGAIEGLYFKIKADLSDTFISATSQVIFNFNGSGRGPKYPGTATQTSLPVFGRLNSTNLSTSYTKAYYHYSGDNSIQNSGPDITMSNIICKTDARLVVMITPGNKYKYTLNLAQTAWSAEAAIPTSPVIIQIGNSQNVSLTFQSGTYNSGDRFAFNIRGRGALAGTPAARDTSGFGLPLDMNQYNPGNGYGGTALLQEPAGSVIYPSAQITIEINYDSAPGSTLRATGPQVFTSNNYYTNLEEWFYESGAYATFVQYKDENSTNNIGSKGVTFRNGSGYGNTSGANSTNLIYQTPNAITGSSLYMCIQGFGKGSAPNQRNEIKASLKVTQTPLNNKVTAETVPNNDDVDIYYEMSRTYPIKNGNHVVLWDYDQSIVLGLSSKLTQTSKSVPHYFAAGQTVYITAPNIPAGTAYTVLSAPDRYSIIINYVVGSSAGGGVSNNNIDKNQNGTLNNAVIKINNPGNVNSDYNAYCYGNGIESNRILDNFNEPWLKYSLRANSIIDKYEQQVKDASLTYSGLYRWDSSINRLNEFNLSVANFKNLDKNFGSVQKLYARTTDLVVLHQDKITSVLYGKNLLVDAVGGGSVASVPEVLGTQIALPYEFGISSNPESFAVWSDRMYFSDAKRGVVLQMQGDQVIQISRMGLSDYFRDIMIDSFGYAKLGAYDPYNHTYVIASTNRNINPCNIVINPSTASFAFNTGGQLEFLFAISGNSQWNISVIDNGFGTNWIEVPPYCQSGVGAQDIFARIQNNISSTPRSVKLRVYYCSTYVDYILKQGRDQKIGFNIITLGTDD
jgi:hypothetical protein